LTKSLQRISLCALRSGLSSTDKIVSEMTGVVIFLKLY
jgi:hypothetical protein